MSRFWKIFKYLTALVLSLLLLDLAVIIFFSLYRPPIQKVDAIVVLGAAINTQATYNRSLQGLKLYEQDSAPILVLAGGVDYPKSISEAQYMQNVILQNAGDHAPNMVLDKTSQSTFENLQNTKKLVPEAHSIIIVSDSFHLARAVITARRMGFNPVYWSSPKPVYYKPTELAYYYMREVFAMISYIPKLVGN